MARQTGKIKFFNTAKGFGFITGKSGDVFFHVSALPEGTDSIPENADVTYDTEQSQRGPRAIDIVRGR